MISAASSSSSSAAIDPWDQPPSSATASRRTTRPPRDDWEDDEDDEEEDPDFPARSLNPNPTVESNRRLWEDADSKPSAPMPSVILSTSTTTPVVAPPAGAFQPTMRILKRPSATSNPSSGSTTPLQGGGADAEESLREREKRYLEARERIFGSEKEDLKRDSGDRKQEVAGVKIVREPKGPAEGQSSVGGQAKGFSGRRAGPPQA